MKTLPKYFVIKKDENNPLWEKYLDWMNDKYGTNWSGNWLYYGFDGNQEVDYNGTNAWDEIKLFQNNLHIFSTLSVSWNSTA